jgi:hypothetical protein
MMFPGFYLSFKARKTRTLQGGKVPFANLTIEHLAQLHSIRFWIGGNYKDVGIETARKIVAGLRAIIEIEDDKMRQQ